MGFKRLWFIIGGLLIIVCTAYFRLLRPRVAGPISMEYSDLKFYLYLCFILLLALGLLIALFAFRIKGPSAKDGIVRTWIKDKFLAAFHVVHTTYSNMVDSIGKPLYRYYLYRLVHFWQKIRQFLANNQDRISLVINILLFLPPCLISLIFCVETVIFNCYTVFPYSPLIIAIPISTRLVLYFFQISVETTAGAVDDNIEQFPWVPSKEEPNLTLWGWKEGPGFRKDDPNCTLTNEELATLIELKHTLILDADNIMRTRVHIVTAPERIIYITSSLLLWIASFVYLTIKMFN